MRGMDDYLESIRRLQEAMEPVLNVYNNLNINAMQNAISPLTETMGLYDQRKEEILGGYTKMWNDVLPDRMMTPYLENALSTQYDIIATAQKCVQTPEISNLLDSFYNNHFDYGVLNFLQKFEMPYTPVANVALLKCMDGILDQMEVRKIRGVKTFVKKIHRRTAERLTGCDNIQVDLQKKLFVADDTENRADVHEMNIISSSTDLFQGICEAELIDFMNELCTMPEFAGGHPVARKIYEIISGWNDIRGFDCEAYYHARGLSGTQCPYSEAEMGCAPRIYVGAGRYNHVGQSHYYFADTPEGAATEIRKHQRPDRIEIATVTPVREIRMIDLSTTVKTPNKFLEYIRFEIDNPEDRCPRQYLIPSFVTTCCKRVGIEGIKYYGSAKYTNYVAWNDGYFRVTDLKII